MASQRYSCDRCRQHKVRCLKLSREAQGDVELGNGEHLGTCERCTKAEVPCVYSSRQKKGRGSSHRLRRDSNVMSLSRSMPFSQDFAGLLSGGGDAVGSVPGDIGMPLLDMGDMSLPGFDNADFYGWDNGNPSPSSISKTLQKTNGGFDFGPQRACDDGPTHPGTEPESTVDALIGQVMAISTRATRATRQLDRRASSCTPLMANSPEINEAFEAANALVHIVNNIPMTPSAALPPEENDTLMATTSGLIFMAVATHQHVLALFKAICFSIQRSVGFNAAGQQNRNLYGDGATCAQFVMVLQLIMHLVNRLGRSLRMETRKRVADPVPDNRVSDTALFQVQDLTPPVDGEDELRDPSRCVVRFAQEVLVRLPDEHIKLRQTIHQLQTHMEERLHI